MNKNIPAKALIPSGIALYASYYAIGGFIGSAIAIVGFLLFWFGIAGLFTNRKSRKMSKLNKNLTYIYEGNVSLEVKKKEAYKVIGNTDLSLEEKQEIWDNFKGALQ